MFTFLTLVGEMTVVSTEVALFASVLIHDKYGRAFEIDDVRYLTTVLECEGEM